MNSVLSFLDPWLVILADDPFLRSFQLTLLGIGLLDVFLIFFATRDIMQRTTKFPFMIATILLVSLLPGVGFLLYMLVRPATTIRERELEEMVRELLDEKAKV
jgi:hypothetical protein